MAMLVLLLGVNAAVALWAGMLLVHGRAQDERNAQLITQNLSLVLAENIGNRFRDIDLGMRYLGRDLQARSASAAGVDDADIRSLLTFTNDALGRDDGAVVTDAAGTVLAVAGSLPRDAGSRVTAAVFAAAREQSVRRTIITDPIRLTGGDDWVIACARRYDRADGRFAGVIVITVPVRSLVALLSGLDLGPHGIAVLRDSSLGQILRYPPTDPVTMRVGARRFPPELAAAVAAGRQSATFHALFTADGVERTETYRRLVAPPFHVIVGLASQDYLRGWTLRRRDTVVEFAIFALTTSLIAWLLWRLIRHLRYEMERNRNMLRGASDGLHILTREGQLIEASDSFFERLGYRREELTGRDVTIWDAAHKPDELLAWHRKAVDGQEHFALETRHRRKDGSIFDVEVSCFPIDIDGRRAMFASARDITDRKRAEHELAQSEARFRNLFERNSCVMVILDAEITRIVDANQAAVAFYGYPRERLIEMPLAEISLMSHEEMANEQAHAAREGRAYCNFRHRLASGEVRDVEVYRTPVPLGGTPMLVSIIHDVTERKRGEARLKLAASVFTHANEGIMITDAKGTILEVNDMLCRITGYDREEVIGQNPRMFKSGRQTYEDYVRVWKILLETGHWSGEIWNRRKNGEVFAELQTISAVYDADGKVQNYVALFTDITQMKNHQQQLQRIAHYDALTGLPNRVLLSDRLQQALVQGRRRDKSVAVVYIDLDGFKAVNDTHGHDAGDALLIAVANRMKTALREGDTLARIGGDEFVAVLGDLEDFADCEPVLVRLLRAASDPVQLAQAAVQVSASIGVTVYPEDDGGADQLMRHADQAMYEAKQTGKNRYCVFAPDRNAAVPLANSRAEP